MALPSLPGSTRNGHTGDRRSALRLRSILVLTLALPLQAQAERYTLDTEHSLPAFEVNHLGFSTQRGRFDRVQGQIELDLVKGNGTVEFIIDAASISMGSERWNTHLKGEDWFDVARYPEIRFSATALTFSDGVPVGAKGELTLRGTQRPVSLTISHFHCGIQPILKKPVCAGDIDAHLKRSDFGMIRYLPGVGDDIAVHVPVEAYRE